MDNNLLNASHMEGVSSVTHNLLCTFLDHMQLRQDYMQLGLGMGVIGLSFEYPVTLQLLFLWGSANGPSLLRVSLG